MQVAKVVSRLLISRSKSVVPFGRNIHTTRTYKAAEPHDHYTDIGYNLPFKIDNPYTLMLKFCLYFGTGFWYPFFCYHYNRVNHLKT